MSIGSKIGQLSHVSSCEVKNQMKCTWTIENIFAYMVNDSSYCSPLFSLHDSEWYFRIYPNGTFKNNSVGWISLYLKRHGNKTSPKYANYSFGVKKLCGVVEQMGEDLNWVFGEGDSGGFGRHRFIETSELLRRKSELTSSDALTLTCSLSVMDDTFYSTTPLDTLSKNFAELFISKKGCDVTFKVQHQEFPVHKYILSARSTVFAAMFESEMKEKETGVVDIVDCDPGAFEDFLTFLYSAKFRMDSINKVFELYKIADKYCVAELRSLCVLYMMRHLTVENVCDVAVLGDQFDNESLKEKTKLFFNANFGKIIHTASWNSLLKSNSPLVNDILINMASANNL